MHKIFFLDSKNHKICGIIEEPGISKKEIVIIIHGYDSNKDSKTNADLAGELAKTGLNSFRIDLDGRGESEGRYEDFTISSGVDDVLSAMDMLEKKGYEKISLYGSSSGGLIAMSVALAHEVHRMVLKAPVSDYPLRCIECYGKAALDECKKKGYMEIRNPRGKLIRIGQDFIEDSRKHIIYGRAKDIQCPVLVIHGDQDNVVHVSQSQNLVKELPHAKFVIIPGADHYFIDPRHHKMILNLVVSWFQKGFSR